MFDVTLKSRTSAASKRPTAAPYYRPAMSLLAATAVVLLSGCNVQPRDSVIVGSIPDDYRTNHPIVIAEKQQAIDIPVGAGERGMTRSQRVSLGGFLDDYDRSAAPVLSIQIPSGSANEVAAADAGRGFVQFAKANGVPRSRIVVSSYSAPAVDESSPIRVSYVGLKAQTDKCGRWPSDISESSENKHYADFGCSYQNNLAAQVADPADLIGPRKQTTIDAEQRSGVIDRYRNAVPDTGSEVQY